MKTKNLNFHIRFSSGLNRLAFVSFAFVTLFLAVIINPPVSLSGVDAIAGAPNASESSISVTSATPSAIIDLTNKISLAGSFVSSTSEESATIAVSTNNYTGYNLSIVASNDNGSLTTSDGSSSIDSISSTTSLSDFSANTTSASEDYNGKWGFKPSKYIANNGDIITNNSDNPVYLPSPTTTPTMLDKTTTANTENSTNDYTLALGVRADYSVHPGSYTKVFSLVALANPVSYSITYDKNTEDTVTNIPATQASDSMTDTNLTLSNTIPQRAHYSFLGWCSVATTNSNGVDSCSGTIYNPNGDGTNLNYGIDQTTTNNTRLYAMWKIDTFAQTTQARYENVDGTWGDYTTVDTQNIAYGGSYSWSTSQIANFDTVAYQSASIASYTVADTKINKVDIYRQKYLQTSYVGVWEQPDGSLPTCSDCKFAAENIRYGASYSATYNPGSDSTYKPASTETYVVTGAKNNYVTAYLKTFTLTVNRNSTYISSVTGGGTYRVGQTVNISATASSGSKFTSWSQTAGTTGTFGNTSSANTTFVMPMSNATVYANGQSSSAKLYFQNATSAQCGQTMYDNRGDDNYKNIAYTTASINGLCWMTRNLDLPGGTTITPANSNVTSNFTLPASSTSGFNNVGAAYVYNSNSTTCGNGSPCYSYYSYTAAVAGAMPPSNGSDPNDATSDICPKGWRLPTKDEYDTLITTYTTGATLTTAPFLGAYAGQYGSNGFFGGSGFYWTSTHSPVMGGRYSFVMYFGSSSNATVHIYGVPQIPNINLGFSVRCVAKS